MGGSNEFLPQLFTETMHQDSVRFLLNSDDFYIRLSAGQIPAQKLEIDMHFELIKRSRCINVLHMFIFGRSTVFALKNRSAVGSKSKTCVLFLLKPCAVSCDLIRSYDSLD